MKVAALQKTYWGEAQEQFLAPQGSVATKCSIFLLSDPSLITTPWIGNGHNMIKWQWWRPSSLWWRQSWKWWQSFRSASRGGGTSSGPVKDFRRCGGNLGANSQCKLSFSPSAVQITSIFKACAQIFDFLRHVLKSWDIWLDFAVIDTRLIGYSFREIFYLIYVSQQDQQGKYQKNEGMKLVMKICSTFTCIFQVKMIESHWKLFSAS